MISAAAAVVLVSIALLAAATVQSGYPQYPSLTPDGEIIVFSRAGDLWTVPVGGGAAARLTSHPADELRSAISPDGSLLAFESTREGARNIYIADLSRVGDVLVAGAPRRLTVADSTHNLSGFNADGSAVLFSSFQDREIFREERMYIAPLDGGPITRITDAHGELPSMSPEGDAVVFARGSNNGVRPKYRGPASGELWRLNLSDNSFTRLTDDRNDDIEPHAQPDGSVVYISSADGQYNVWRIPAQGARAVQLTDFQPTGAEYTIAHGVRDLATSRDGSKAVFAVWDTLYTLALDGNDANPRAVEVVMSADSDALETMRLQLDSEATEAVLSPDGQTMAIVARGEIFVRSTKEDHPTRRVTFGEAREQDIAWSPDGARLYFVSDRDGPPSIYAAKVQIARQDLEPQEEPSEDAELETGEPAEEEIPEAAPEGEAASGGAKGEADESEDKKEDDKEDEGPTPGERWAEAIRFTIEPVVVTEHADTRPHPSPDGDDLLFVRGRGDLMLFDIRSGDITTLQPGWDEPEAHWASNGRHIVFSRRDLQFNSDIYLMDVRAAKVQPGSEAAEPVNLTRHPDLDVAPRLSHDGKVLYFLSDRDNENWAYDVYAVFLDDSLEDLADYQLAAYFEEAAKAAGKRKPLEPVDPASAAEGEETENSDEVGNADAEAEKTDEREPFEFDSDDAFLRIRRLTSIPASEGDLTITPAGNRVIFSSNVDSDSGLFSVDYRGRERKTITTGGVGSVSTNLTGDKVTFVKGGVAHTAAPAGGETTRLAIDATVTIDADTERAQKFDEAARVFGMTFYHPTLKGLNWDRTTERYRELALQTRTAQAFTRVLATMFGEVDGSHTGSWGGDGYNAPNPNVGLLGIDAEPEDSGYRVTRVLRDGPADDGEHGLLAGDLISHINGDPLARNGRTHDLQAAMIGTAGKETLVTVRRLGPGGLDAEPRERHLLLIPQSQGAETNLRYRDEVERRKTRVDDWSGGRIGYLHIRGMSAPSVRDYERDLYAAAHGKEGLIIDVRDNGGGWTTDILLASLTAPAHAYTIPRGADPELAEFDSYPRDRRLIHAYQRPLTVLCNQNSFSNAEIFSHAIKTTGRGTLVGEQTHGSVISTGSHRLIDGTVIRIPFRGWYLPDGTDMEHNGAIPDIRVDQLPSHEAAGEDPQLRVAVEELLGRIDRGDR